MPKNHGISPTPPAKPPDGNTVVHELVNFLWKEGHLLKSPSFYIAVLMAAIGAFAVSKWHFSGIIEEKEATITQKEATITTISLQRDSIRDEKITLERENDSLKKYRSKD